jgi:glutathione S-transferase
MSLQLVIGNKNYSSWSLRAWLLLAHYELDFHEIPIALFTPGYKDELARYSPSLKVPTLIDEELSVWESLAICEYVNEVYLDGRALPSGREARALCRSFCNEMHAGFSAIRSELPMNCRARKRVTLSPEVLAEVARIDALWTQGRRRFVEFGPYLFGKFSLADCMFAPVVMRFQTYGVALGPEATEYCASMLENPALQRWVAAAREEPLQLPQYEVGEDVAV